MRTGDIEVVAENGYDIGGSRLISSYRFTRGDEEVSATAIHHVYTVAHLGALLAEGGFTGIERFGGPGGEPYELGTGRLLLTARRA
jgi:hypothetical protein